MVRLLILTVFTLVFGEHSGSDLTGEHRISSLSHCGRCHCVVSLSNIIHCQVLVQPTKIFLRFAQLTRAIDICWLSSVSTAELLVSLIQQAWIFQTDRIPSTHWALDICRLSSVSTAELLVSLIQNSFNSRADPT